MRYLTLPLLALLGACTAQPTGVSYIGIPVDEGATTAYIKSYAAYLGRSGALDTGTVDVRPLSEFRDCAHLGLPGGCPHESFGSADYYIVTEGPGDALGDWHYTSLAHELTHALYGDPNHLREDLWGIEGIVDRWNGWVDGHNPARQP